MSASDLQLEDLTGQGVSRQLVCCDQCEYCYYPDRFKHSLGGFVRDAVLGWLDDAVSRFGASCKMKLSGAGGTEAAIRGPMETLLGQISEHHALRELSWHDEVLLPELGVRPDYAVRIAGEATGYIEVKKPGLPVDPQTFTGRNKEQWRRLSDLPNLLYTNGTEWRLFRDGRQVGETVWLVGDLKRAGAQLTAAEPAAFDALMKEFLVWAPPPITRVQRLVQHVAPLCRLLRAAVLEQLTAEAKSSAPEGDLRARPFTGLKGDWRRLLFPSADNATFADGYAQAVTFALLLARTEGIALDCGLHEIGRRLDAGHALMGRALQLLTDNVNARFSLTLELLTRTIGVVDWPTIRRADHDAYLHLYEKFLTVYDADLRQKSGSYYTPYQVVEDMVRLTEDVLRTRLDRRDGFASGDVRIVDPAMGTGTFLHSVIERVAAHAVENVGAAGARDAIGRLAERLFGFELQMGPFAVAEMRASELLHRYGAPLPPDGLNLCVTDTLDNPFIEDEQLASGYLPLAESRKRANRIKATTPVTVVLGNPPYDDKAENRGGWVEKRPDAQAGALLDDFRLPGNGRYEHVLKNMYVYFWRWASWKVFDAHDLERHGVVCFITPSGFATGPGGRGMRSYLRRTCDEGWIINLTPEGIRPEVNTRVFPGVAQPLAICIFVRRAACDEGKPARLHYRSLSGRREEKFRLLRAVSLDDDGWRDVHEEATEPFTPRTQSGWDDYPTLLDLFPWGTPGVKSNRSWVTAPGAETLRRRWARFIREHDPAEKAVLLKSTPDRDLATRREPLPGQPAHDRPLLSEVSVVPDLVRTAQRSFDRQWLVADNRVLDRPRPELWAARSDVQLFLNQQTSHAIDSGPAVVATALIPDTHHFNGRGGRIAPLLHPDGSANVSTDLLNVLAAALGASEVTALDLACYVLGIAGHPGFTQEFTEELLTPGVRIPLTRNLDLWHRAVDLGACVIWASTYGERCHDDALGRPQGRVAFAPGDPRQVRYESHIGDSMPERMSHDAANQTLYVGAGTFAPVPETVHVYDVGGMNILSKWFGYRKAKPNRKRTSPLDDIHVDRWPSEWTDDLIELLSVLRRLTDLVPTQRDLLAAVLAQPVLTQADLTAAGVLPLQPAAWKPRHSVTGGLFDTSRD
ncbi:N-6 DNA methylase [Yinghuangia sp. ASG 101]|uniref:type ISP restriction/modification enzyme n=1 Tax=Yinghuangia sp. ASG 101 TaxID=2896848 RepID=UPI001E35FF37|nr:type ISP restriction/modification enzyme [Yinghuangia sp. ASG 101]UGQ13551.1 N-6 DNA methylase [Yinghuangia sp. ASG 101]